MTRPESELEQLRYPLADAAIDRPEDALARLMSSPEGLGEEEAGARLAHEGANAIPRVHGPSLLRQFASQLLHFFAVMLWLAALLAFVGGLQQLGWAIIVVVLINGVFSFVQEFKAERATRSLADLLPERATVNRAGRVQEVLGEQLVRGDVLLLREGDRVCADARVLRSTRLKVDNSLLTGESESVERTVEAEVSRPEDALDARCVVFAGTHVASGSGEAVVVATGEHTRLGRISELTGRVVRRSTPLRVQLDRMVRVIGLLAMAAGGLFYGISLAMGESAANAFLFGVGVIVALIPEGLLPTFTLSLAMGARRMADRGALIRHLDAVETLGCTTVICSDKTGTITTNQMTAREVALLDTSHTISGSGYQPVGTLYAGDRPLALEERERLTPLLRAAALCGDARVEERDGRWRCVGDPTEGALVVLARKGGVERDEEERKTPRVVAFPFESARQRMTTIHALPAGTFEALTKGAPEIVLPLCKSGRIGGELIGFGDDEALEMRKAIDRMAIQGLRLLALARRDLAGTPPETPEEVECDMEFLGLVGMADPIRPEVPEAVARCHDAGIRVIMITGDHPATAMKIAREIGLPAESVVIGSELPDDDAALARLIGTRISVLARTSPEQKLRIAGALQSRGEVVAMTGDGVNDAPALRRADIGIAMGRSGTDVAREAADLVLLDDNFAHIVEAVEEGRSAFENMQRFLTYVLTSNVPELAPFLVWAMSRGAVPLGLTVLQILAIDLVTDLLPALALGAEPPSPRLMAERPRAPQERLLDRRVLVRAYGFLGPIEAAGSLLMIPLGAALFFGWRPGGSLPQSGAELATLSAMLWAAVVTAQVANGYECRSKRTAILQLRPSSNRLLLGAIGVEVIAMMSFVYFPPIASILKQRPLRLVQWLPVLIAPVLLLAGEETRKAIVRKRTARGSSRRTDP
ncbi:MAG: cation-transporting P-type ATPase [Actinobacteria bacterium]|nr:cation-transporting P-type ATPase [Actinomycetota bacterium]